MLAASFSMYGINPRPTQSLDGIMNSTAYTMSQTLWRTSKLED